MAAVPLQNMACSKAVLTQAAVSLPKSSFTTAMLGASTSCMCGDSVSKTCAVSGQRKVSQIRGTSSKCNFDTHSRTRSNILTRGKKVVRICLLKRQSCTAKVRADSGTGRVEVTEAKKGGTRGTLKKVVLAYSGGLDTSLCVPWLRENYGCEVVCFLADVGQGVEEIEGVKAKATASGASEFIVEDLREEFVKDYIFPCLRACT